MFDSSVYARYEVSGPGAEAWLDRLLACRLPAVGRMRLAPMLGHGGKLMGDLTVNRLASDRFWLIGSYYLQEWHGRWFREQMPASGVSFTNLSDAWTGFALSGPKAREISSSSMSSGSTNWPISRSGTTCSRTTARSILFVMPIAPGGRAASTFATCSMA